MSLCARCETSSVIFADAARVLEAEHFVAARGDMPIFCPVERALRLPFLRRAPRAFFDAEARDARRCPIRRRFTMRRLRMRFSAARRDFTAVAASPRRGVARRDRRCPTLPRRRAMFSQRVV